MTEKPIPAAKNDGQFPGPAFGGDPILTALLREAIGSELSSVQAATLRAIWFEGERISGIARAEQISEQAVRKRLKNCYGKLRNALRYAVRYSQLRSQLDDAA
ncbi:MAG: hypothetical protein LBT21_06090 [Oscillospiraceae bacterium]|nr:hypothetical protein [Oscillospiraceae bacterium]